MAVSCNIDDIISFLVEKKKEGYKTVEVLTEARKYGWKKPNPTITFLYNKKEPTVLGISIDEE